MTQAIVEDKIAILCQTTNQKEKKLLQCVSFAIKLLLNICL